jgi:RNA polymerase sigma factor (TIGR02999 family)
MSDITQILQAIEQGQAQATDELFALVYEQLRRLAAQQLAQEKPGQTLDATGLVHEAYLRLVGGDASTPREPQWQNQRHFFAAAAEAMRRILIENARRKQSAKRGGGRARQEFEDGLLVTSEPPEEILALDEALQRFSEIDPIKAELVKLRYFGGLTAEEAAGALGISSTTADRYWAYARAWLYQQIHGDAPANAEQPEK